MMGEVPTQPKSSKKGNRPGSPTTSHSDIKIEEQYGLHPQVLTRRHIPASGGLP